MLITQEEFEELFQESAPQPFYIYYTKAVAVIESFCRNMTIDERFKDAIAIQIKYTFDKEQSVKSVRIGSYSESREQQIGVLSDDVLHILNNLGCSAWIGVDSLC